MYMFSRKHRHVQHTHTSHMHRWKQKMTYVAAVWPSSSVQMLRPLSSRQTCDY